MNEEKTLLTAIIKGLESGIPDLQLAALESAKELAPIDTMPHILALYLNEEADPQVTKDAMRLLIDIRHPALVTALGEALQSNLSYEKRAGLLSLCWQNPIDFSPLIGEMLNALLSESALVVIEAMTALELALDYASIEQIRTTLSQLKTLAKGECPKGNRTFIDECVSITAQYLQQAENTLREEARYEQEKHNHDH